MEERILTVRVHDEGADGLWAEVIDLPGCYTSGQDWDELRAALEEAISLWLSGSDDDAHVEIKDWDATANTERLTVLIPA